MRQQFSGEPVTSCEALEHRRAPWMAPSGSDGVAGQPKVTGWGRCWGLLRQWALLGYETRHSSATHLIGLRTGDTTFELRLRFNPCHRQHTRTCVPNAFVYLRSAPKPSMFSITVSSSAQRPLAATSLRNRMVISRPPLRHASCNSLPASTSDVDIKQGRRVNRQLTLVTG